MSEAELTEPVPERKKQFATFYLGERLYGIEVTKVQEIARSLPITAIHLAPPYVIGLTNLRGQVATAIGLRELFGLQSNSTSDRMSVICKHEGNLLSLLVDRIGDVIEVSQNDFEEAPPTVDDLTRTFMKGVYKTNDSILSVIEINQLSNYLGNFSAKA